MKTTLTALLIFLGVFVHLSAQALPICYDKKRPLALSNSQVMNFKEFTEDDFEARAFVKGIIVSVVRDRKSHIHWEVDLDGDFSTVDDRVEVIYNVGFGPIPRFTNGRSTILVCGDYITDPHSPMGAIIHWVHFSPKPSRHDHGFIVIDGVLTGNQL